uniref:FAM161 centrosomal protein B n=1 Tax=Sphenodon punctatus TaxID=8508 RepID=A0A8D0HN79_SPHPU
MLQALKMKNRQYLLKLGLLYQAKLENYKPSKEDKELEDFFKDNGRLMLQADLYETIRSGNMRQSSSLTDLSMNSPWDKQNHHSLSQSYSRPKSASAAWVSSITIPQPFKMTLREARKKSQLMKSHMSLQAEKQKDKRQSQEEAECQKQFRAQPVPAHIYLPLYQEIMEQNEIRRQLATQKRKELLLSTQRPFSFLEKEEKRKEAIREKVLEALTTEDSKTKNSKKIPKSLHEPMLGDKLKENELYRKIRIQMRAKDLLESSWAPIDTNNRREEPQPRIATKTKQEKLSFLQDSFSFQPRINLAVPDFENLYWAFQRDATRKREIKETTRNKPFKLRTSNLCCRQRQVNQEITTDFQQLSKAPVQRSRSLTCLSSLSSNTLPVHITDAARKRESAIRYLQEDKKHRESEGIRWMELQRKKSWAMSKSVSCRAKAMDSHKSLETTLKEKLKQNWQNDRKRTKEYKKELEEMKMRVKNRPYLFEQVTKYGARQEAERLYQNTLRQVGLNEEFVRNKGRNGTDLPGAEQSGALRSLESLKDTDAGTIQKEEQSQASRMKEIT